MVRGRSPPILDRWPGSEHPIVNTVVTIGSNLKMSDSTFRLLERHQKLDEALRMAQRRRWIDPLEVARLKKLKLAIKDRLSRLARHPQRA